MLISEEWLKEKNACADGVRCFSIQDEHDGVKVVEKLIDEGNFSWANWLIVRLMKYGQYVSYAVFAAEQVIDIYEKRYPNNDLPRKAIEAAKECIKDPSKKNKDAASSAAASYYVTAVSSSSSYDTVYITTYYTVYAAAYSDVSASTKAANAAANVIKETKIKTLNYGIKLLKGNQ